MKQWNMVIDKEMLSELKKSKPLRSLKSQRIKNTGAIKIFEKALRAIR
jgi:hypothetical protein